MTFSQKFSLCRTDTQKQTLGTTRQSESESSFTQLRAVTALGRWRQENQEAFLSYIVSCIVASLGYVRLRLRKAK